VILRLSQNLNGKIKAGPLKTAPLDDNPYADWSARLFTADRTQYILLSNTWSLYSTVMFGRGITSDWLFIERALENLREFMKDDSLEFMYRQFIAPATDVVQFGKALDHSVTGSMNELVAFARAWLIPGELSPYDIGFKLNDVLLSAVARDQSEGYGTPREAFKRMG
jgi:hypothetical protein